ncbi:lipoprotein-anchoring transpeptidase ErfK/SrfK [Pullulanibacillus pueri]|uniref:Putative L,D-transpeptidase YciB n=1 Tax=Pullulanibacillus pueri TaxID=1437324 RepID=A0A8J2ZTV8_9BACL|nr:L,D-transpeptidase [Pullulanibacillus pueri]MBM7681066.1 lipoprotein-anchoring transpeptidase ErfK/SrfK [Pullulanibacillus pueri]GGH76913.1 putative L,D-transpeptidase YciB [Pullulanibacillus pueri]
MKLTQKLSILGLVFILGLIITGCTHSKTSSPEESHKTKTSASGEHPIQRENQQAKADKKPEIQNNKPAVKPVDWTKPTGGAYPKDIANVDHLWIDVSVDNQKVYIKNGDQTLYTMIVSTGLDKNADTSTPKGTFYTQPEKGTWFYSNSEKEGAKYWTSWKNHGEFLFHTVPMDKNQKVITAEAKKLGKKASHGCVRMSIPDAKWIYYHIPVHTKVVIG